MATEVCGVFTKEFTLSFKDRILEEVKAAYCCRKSTDRCLQAAPTPFQAIKRGELFKMGDINKSWKKRHFTVLNKANNYFIEYAYDEGGSSKQGQIICLGYTISCIVALLSLLIFNFTSFMAVTTAFQLFGDSFWGR